MGTDYYLKGEERFGFLTSYVYYFGVKIPSIQRFYRFVLDDLAKSRSSSMLDVGTGPGDIPIMLRKIKPIEIYGIDPSGTMIRIAKSRARNMKGLHFETGSSRHIPFGRKFPLIYTAISFHHWTDKVGSLRYISRFLQRGGELRIYEYNAACVPKHLGIFVPSHMLHQEDAMAIARRAGMKTTSIFKSGPYIRLTLKTL